MGFYGKTELSIEFEKLLQEELESGINELKKEIIPITPIDKGDLKQSYEIKKNYDLSVSLINDRDYAHQILTLGRTGPGLGSLQLPDGILPFIKQWVKTKES